MAATKQQRPTPRSAVRLLQLLQMLADNPDGQSLASLSKQMKPPTPKSSVLNLLRSLVSNQFVSHVDGMYRLGPQSYQLASAILAHREFPEVARPIIKRLVEATGETVLIGVPSQERDAIVYVDKVETRSSLRFAATIGDRRPLYCTSAGIVFLANQPAEWTQEYIRSAKMLPLTPKTNTSKSALRDAVSHAKEHGFGITRDQGTDGVTGIAAPIFDGSGELIAVLILAAPTARIDERTDELVLATQAAGREISRVMGAKLPQG